jgi:signal transduction histidine kinase/ActR/RegA family two-component response regulator
MVVALGRTGMQLLQTRQLLLTDAEQQLSRLAMVFAEQTSRAVETVDMLTRGAIETLPAGAPAGPALDPLLARRIEGLRQVIRVAVADADGAILASSDPEEVGQKLPPAGLAQLAFHRANPAAGVQVSDPLRLPDRRWTALLTRRVEAPGGGFAGITVAYLNLAYFEDFYRAVELPENGAIILHRRDGLILARYPHDDPSLGTTYADQPPFRDVLAHAIAGNVIMDSPRDGSRRVVAIRALRAFPLAVAVSIGEAPLLAGWRRQTWLFGDATVIGVVVVGWLMLVLARRSRRIEELLSETQAARETAEEANRRLIAQMDERERAEGALRQAQRIEAIGQLTGGVAHDFNNLLTVVLGNIDLLQNLAGLDRSAAERLATMRAAAERGAALTAQLLAFARRQPLVPRDVDVNAMLLGMHTLLASALGPRIRIEFALAEDLWPARVDATQLELVVLNLAINARDATPQAGVIAISTRNRHHVPPHDAAPRRLQPSGAPEQQADALAAGDYVLITVADSGTGMTPEVLARAFEPFFTTKAIGCGSGLGLSQVLGVTRQSGGGVRIESEPGNGTSVTVFLPRGAGVVAAQGAAARFTPRPKPVHAMVLVVDDDEAVRGTTVQMVAALGYGTVEAASGGAALALLREPSAVEVLLTDVAMPEMSGPELARQARLLRPALPIVFISGYADIEKIVGESPLGRLLCKPFRSAQLSQALEQALADAAAEALFVTDET